MADYKSLDNLKVTVEVSPVVDSTTGAVSFKGDNILPVNTSNDKDKVLAAIGEMVSDNTKALNPSTITITGGSSSHSSRGGRSRKGKKSKGRKSRKARKSLRRK